MFLTPAEYARVMPQAALTGISDATDEQIAAHDRWFEDARAAEEDDWSRLFDVLGGRNREDVTDA